MTILFTVEQFFGKFAAYNAAIWPAQVAAYVLGLVAVGALWLRRSAFRATATNRICMSLRKNPERRMLASRARRFRSGQTAGISCRSVGFSCKRAGTSMALGPRWTSDEVLSAPAHRILK
jgi:hypothetical protein